MPQKRKLDDVANNPELTRLANQIFEPKRTDGGFAARSIVCLGGLVSAPELNGRMALVVKEMDSGGRMTVTLSGEMNPVPFGGRADTRRVLRVAPKNVRRVPISLGHCPLSFRMRTSIRHRAQGSHRRRPQTRHLQAVHACPPPRSPSRARPRPARQVTDRPPRPRLPREAGRQRGRMAYPQLLAPGKLSMTSH